MRLNLAAAARLFIMPAVVEAGQCITTDEPMAKRHPPVRAAIVPSGDIAIGRPPDHDVLSPHRGPHHPFGRQIA